MADSDVSREIAEYFEFLGLNYYFDEKDEVLKELGACGHSDDVALVESIDRGLAHSSHLLAILSSRTMGSWWVPYEISVARASKIPIAHLLLPKRCRLDQNLPPAAVLQPGHASPVVSQPSEQGRIRIGSWRWNAPLCHPDPVLRSENARNRRAHGLAGVGLPHLRGVVLRGGHHVAPVATERGRRRPLHCVAGARPRARRCRPPTRAVWSEEAVTTRSSLLSDQKMSRS
jgi:hypothetical protein